LKAVLEGIRMIGDVARRRLAFQPVALLLGNQELEGL